MKQIKKVCPLCNDKGYIAVRQKEKPHSYNYISCSCEIGKRMAIQFAVKPKPANNATEKGN